MSKTSVPMTDHFGMIRLVCLLTLGFAAPLAPTQENAPAKDIPYTATVSDREARFVFPIPVCDGWTFGGPAAKETPEYEWSVEVENAGKPYRFGIFLNKGPGQLRHTSQAAPAFFGTGEVLRPGSGDDFSTTSKVRAQPGGLPEAQDYNRLVIVIDDPSLLRELFYSRPKAVTFREVFPDQPADTHQVAISYGDYTYTAPPPPLSAAWTFASTGSHPSTQPAAAAAALAPNGRCAAIAADGAIDVVDIAGHKLWRWDYARNNRFLTVGPLAVSPMCDAVAMVGNSSYKYTWIANRSGHAIPVQTKSTPLSIAFSRSGDFVALGTGGCNLLLLNNSGELQWKKDLNNGLCILGKLSFSADDKFILLQGHTGLVAIDGTPLWLGLGVGMNAARDLQSFVSWFVPSHGPAWGDVSLLDAKGKDLWHSSGPGEPAVISATGDKIAALVYSKQNVTEEEFNNSEQETELDLFSRDGKILKKLASGNTIPIAMSPSGDRVLVNTTFGIQDIDQDGRALFEIPGAYGAAFVPDDFSGVLLLRGAALEWFPLK